MFKCLSLFSLGNFADLSFVLSRRPTFRRNNSAISLRATFVKVQKRGWRLSVGQLQTKSISMPSNAAYFLFEASIRNTFSKVFVFFEEILFKDFMKIYIFSSFFLQRQKQLYHSWPKGQQRMWKEVTTLYIFLPVHILPIDVYSTTQHTSATDLYVGIYVIYMWGALLWPHCGGCWH